MEEEKHKPLSTEEAAKALQMLSPLVEFVGQLSKPGDVILFCPTSILFRIPLYTINIGGKPLIECNSVVYTQSLSVFRHCQLSAMSLDTSQAANPFAVQALCEKESAKPTAPSMKFVRKIGARLLTGTELLMRTFVAACTDSTLIHFYGHIKFSEEKALDHYMAVRNLDHERLTARDVFNIHLRSGAYVSLIRCEGARAHLGTNDDLLGLSTAFIYAGASSLISALWSIDFEDGDIFQEAFYDELLKQSSTATSDGRRRDFLDLATALQQAVLRISVDESGRRKALYHWAAFMLQGC